MITIAAPDTLKTQSQVIPNLLTYPGSAFVLDVKGELWATTAAHRAKSFGPTYRFSPTEPENRSHCYNPFDFVPPDPVGAAMACELFAANLIPDNPNLKDPYWEKRARDILWALAMLVALDRPPAQRILSTMARLLGTRTNFEDDEEAYKGSSTEKLVNQLKVLGTRTSLAELVDIGISIHDGIKSTRLGSVFDTARTYLNNLNRSPMVAASTASSDWHPRQLREHTGTTVYLSFRPGEMAGFAGIIQLILQQHAHFLTREFTHRPGTPPIAFFLDEAPQLGTLPSLTDLMDVGRGAGVRLWLFAQYLGQIRSAYRDRANGIVGACAVRCFMQPDKEAYELIRSELGTVHNLITGEKRPLAEHYELTGRTHGDKLLSLARNDLPALLEKRPAFKTHADLIGLTPPEVPKRI